MWIERSVHLAKPPTTKVDEAPKVAILAASVPTKTIDGTTYFTGADTDGVLKILFGNDAQYVATTVGPASLEYATSDPLAGYDVIVNAGAGWPGVATIATTNGATESGGTVTITTTGPCEVMVGQSVTIAGVAVAGYNGTFTVSAVISPTQFQYTNPTIGLASSGRGTVTGATVNAMAQSRLNAFFARGGGYIAQSSSTSNFSFLTSAMPALVTNLTQGSQSAYGGIALWNNLGGATSPITGAYPASDNMFLPSNTTYFTAVPADAIVDGTYPATIATVGPQYGYIAGMWLNRDIAANSAPVLIHGTTTADSRYVAYATNPFSRYDAEREWPLIVQAALWSDLTDE